MRTPKYTKISYLLFVICAATTLTSAQTTFSTLYNFCSQSACSDGSAPLAGLVQGINGDFYGTTYAGGSNSTGTIFSVTPSGALTTMYSFCAGTNCPGGNQALGGLALSLNGNLYGTTSNSGSNCPGTGCGTVYEITPAGTFSTLYNFCALTYCTDGGVPFAGLLLASNGNFYGTTAFGGNRSAGEGTFFEITPAGKLTTLHRFCALKNCPDGAQPNAPLIQASNGNFYGTTLYGGVNSNNTICNSNGRGCGTVFEISPAGKFTILYSFCAQTNCADGALPLAGLVQASNGNLYGVAEVGGISNSLCGYNGCGTIFEITPTGKFTTLYRFCSLTNCTDGAGPETTLIEGTDGSLYGITLVGGAHNDGTVFKITPSGTLTTLYTFCAQTNCADGSWPYGLIQATSGTFYGTTRFGGANNDGTIFTLSTGLGPFVEALPTSGKVGMTVVFLGNDLTKTTKVTFNGTTAAFKVVSATEIKTTVPAGATTGPVEVTTNSGTLSSNIPFGVIP